LELLLISKIILIFFSLSLAAFFSGAQTVLFALGHAKLQQLKAAHHPGAPLVQELLDKPRRLYLSTLVGSLFFTVAFAVLSTSLCVSLIGNQGIWIAILIMVPLIIFLGEVLPRTFALSHSEQYSLIIAKPITAFIKALLPLRWLIKKLLTFLIKPFGNQNKPGKTILHEEPLSELPEEDRDQETIPKDKRELVHKILAFSDTVVSTIMTPRSGMFALSSDLSMAELLREVYRHISKMQKQKADLTTEEATMIDRLSEFSQTLVREAMIPFIEITAVEDTATIAETIEIISNKGHSRLPVYHERIDNVIGIVNSFDLLGASQTGQPILSLIRMVPFVPESKPIDELLIELQKSRTHMAIAVDEYGGTVGIITMEDILEEIVGEIQDEYDTADRVYRKIGWNRYRVSARMELDQLQEKISLDLPDGDYETLGGFLLKQFEHIPSPGEITTYKNYTFTIESSDDRSIGEVRIRIDKRTKITNITSKED
jgi:CBS domain containing-hemolysin-like protein